MATITRSIGDRPLTPDSPGMLHQQKAEDGNGKLARGLAPHFAEPADFAAWHYLTQLRGLRVPRVPRALPVLHGLPVLRGLPGGGRQPRPRPEGGRTRRPGPEDRCASVREFAERWQAAGGKWQVAGAGDGPARLPAPGVERPAGG